MAKFKVGDKVRVVQDEGWSFDTKGKVYTVVATHKGFINQHSIGEVSLNTLSNWPHEFELVKEGEEVQEFVNRKFRVKNAKHSRQIQETLFSLGYEWMLKGKDVCYTNEPCLFANEDGTITWGDERCFEQSEFQEAVVVAHTSYSIEDVVKRETVELNGLTYLKTDLEAALKKLTPVGGGK